MPRERLVGRKSQVLDEHVRAVRFCCPLKRGDRDVCDIVVRNEESRRHGRWIDLRNVSSNCDAGANDDGHPCKRRHDPQRHLASL
jgi:hypothetical protein